jgi:8-oxo-dGTP pyrophosphatase MutT (NUDIX family)
VSRPDLDQLQQAAASTGRRCCVGAIVFDSYGRVFVPRRSPESPNLPGLWDIVGGHVEAGETLLEALHREVHEETGWMVAGEPRLNFVSEWMFPNEPDAPRRGFDFVVTVDGDLTKPRLARDEHTDFRWITRHELALFDENRGQDDGMLRRTIASAYEQLPATGLRAPHATIFVDVPSRLADTRRQWDPVMAAQIAPHVTVAYPHDVDDVDVMVERVRSAAREGASFGLRLGEVVHAGDPNEGVFVAVDDVAGGWARLRTAIAGAPVDDPIPPHVTLVHPRTSGLGALALDALRGQHDATTVEVHAVSVTAYDGERWRTVETFALS